MERLRASDGVTIVFGQWGTPGADPPARNTPIALDRITAPTLVLVSADDPLAARPQDLAAAIPGARRRVVIGDHLTALRAPAYLPALPAFIQV